MDGGLLTVESVACGAGVGARRQPAAWGDAELALWKAAAPKGARLVFHEAAPGRSLALDRRDDPWLEWVAGLFRDVTRQRRQAGGGWLYWAEGSG